MRKFLIVALILLSPILAGAGPIPKVEWDNASKLWLARSCVGESGFGAVDECVGIAWVYATIAKENHVPFLHVIRSYSAAVKEHEKHRRPWIFELNLRGDRPENWPERLSWKVHKKLWKTLLVNLDSWAAGKIENPVPGANHFGGSMDTPGKKWIRISPKSEYVFRNRFYRSGGV